MRTSFARSGVVTAAIALCCSCSGTPQAASIHVGMLMPKGWLDNVDSVEVYIAAQTDTLTCTPGTGAVTVDMTKEPTAHGYALEKSDPNSPCPDNGVFCSSNIPLARDPSTVLVFQAIGSKAGDPIAMGCTSGAVSADPYLVNITMMRYIQPAVCGDGKIEAGEQCDPGQVPAPNDPICDTQCRTKEILLSADNRRCQSCTDATDTITNAPAHSKSNVALAFSTITNGVTNPNPLHAVFGDINAGSSGGLPEINYRQMSQDLLTITNPPLLTGQIRLPWEGQQYLGFAQRPQSQILPAVATMTNGSVLVAYNDNRTNTYLISLTPLSASATPQPDQTGGSTSEADNTAPPAIADNGTGTALVVWTDKATGKVWGRIWTGSAWAAKDFAIGTKSGSHPKVAGTGAAGWVVVWQGSDDIMSATVSLDGKTIGTAATVNSDTSGAQDQPSIGSTEKGAYAIVWRSNGSNLVLQRYDSTGAAVAGDQNTPVNSADGLAGANPAIVGSTLDSDFYAIVWQASDNTIRARFADNTNGYLFNSIDGQDGSFAAGYPGVQTPHSLPAVAVGGGGYVVFAWQDDSDTNSGIWSRRFPLPDRL